VCKQYTHTHTHTHNVLLNVYILLHYIIILLQLSFIIIIIIIICNIIYYYYVVAHTISCVEHLRTTRRNERVIVLSTLLQTDVISARGLFGRERFQRQFSYKNNKHYSSQCNINAEFYKYIMCCGDEARDCEFEGNCDIIIYYTYIYIYI